MLHKTQVAPTRVKTAHGNAKSVKSKFVGKIPGEKVHRQTYRQTLILFQSFVAA